MRFLALSVSDAAEDVIAVIRAGALAVRHEDDRCPRPHHGDPAGGRRGRRLLAPARRVRARRLRRRCGEIAEVDEELDRLSAREREVMRLIARGYQYKEVAKELFISVKTVETHVTSVLRKLQLSSRHELTAWAMGRRLSDACRVGRQGRARPGGGLP